MAKNKNIAEEMIANNVPIEKMDKEVSKEAEKIENDLKGLLMSSPVGSFVVLQVPGGVRIAKDHKWVSPVMSSIEANKICSDMNRKDPQQKDYNKFLNSGVAPAIRGVGDIQEM